jgi:hypothetical protein
MIQLSAFVAAFIMLSLGAPMVSEAACRNPQTTGVKTLLSRQTDRTSYFTLTRGAAVIETNIASIPDRCRRGGLTFDIVSRQTGDSVNCRRGSDKGPDDSLRCNVNVLGGVYYVRTRNPTACTVRYRNTCRNS